MTEALYLRLKSLNTRTVRGVTSPKNIVRVAAMHNLREIQAELGASAASGINAARMHLNYQLRGPATADGVAALALALLDNAGVQTLRRDACMALELVVSLPANTTTDHRAYFAAAVAWADTHFNVPVLSAAVHLDEAAPHCHILLLPLVAGRMQGGALAGGPAKIRAMLADFQEQVAQRFGMTHQPRAKRLSKPKRDAAGRMVLDALRARPERLREPAMGDALVAALGSQAETLLALLGLTMPTAKAAAKTFVEIMTAPCKPERIRCAAPNAKHIDVAQNLGNQEGEKFDNVYLCVDVAPSPSPNPAHEHPQQPTKASTADQQADVTDDASQAGQRGPCADAAHQQAVQGMQNILDTPAAGGSQQNGDQVDHHRDGGMRPRRTPCGAGLQQQVAPSSGFRTKSRPAARGDHEPVPTQAGAAAAPNSGLPITSAPKPTTGDVQAASTPVPNCSASGGSVRSTWAAQPPMGDGDYRRGRTALHPHAPSNAPSMPQASPDGDYQRYRDDDRPAEHWNSERGEFALATGPPSARHLHP